MKEMEEYPRSVTRDFIYCDPVELAKETEKIVCKDLARKYTDFYTVGVYGGISTGYVVGCCLRCIFCWTNWSRDFPEKMGSFFSPQQVFEKLILNVKKRRVPRLRISGGEPTLGKEHLLAVLGLVNNTDYQFILETNGILFGVDKNYVYDLKKYRNVYIRLCLKAGSAEGFQRRTGAKGEFYELPFLGIKNLVEAGLDFHVACMSDPRLMSQEEKGGLLGKLREVGYQNWLEEEICDPYATSIARLKKAGFSLI